MPSGFDAAPSRADDRVLPPVRLPFTIRSLGPAARPGAAGRRSWGNRLGLWWADAEEGEPGVVITGLLPTGLAARAGAVQVGDLVVDVEGQPVKTLGDITRVLETHGPGALHITVRRGAADERNVVLDVPPEPGETAPAAGGAGAGFSAQVPETDFLESLRSHIQLILSSPLQAEVTQPGAAADPGFGCLGADLEFSLQKVGLSEIRNAVVRCEPRLKEVEVDAVQFEARVEGERVPKEGIRVTGVVAATGEKVHVDLEVELVTRARRAHRRRGTVDAGVEGR